MTITMTMTMTMTMTVIIHLSHYESSNTPGDMAVESLHPPRVLTNLVLIL